MNDERTNDDNNTLRDANNTQLRMHDVVRIDECDDDVATMTTFRIVAIDVNARRVTMHRTHARIDAYANIVCFVDDANARALHASFNEIRNECTLFDIDEYNTHNTNEQ